MEDWKLQQAERLKGILSSAFDGEDFKVIDCVFNEDNGHGFIATIDVDTYITDDDFTYEEDEDEDGHWSRTEFLGSGLVDHASDLFYKFLVNSGKFELGEQELLADRYEHNGKINYYRYLRQTFHLKSSFGAVRIIAKLDSYSSCFDQYDETLFDERVSELSKTISIEHYHIPMVARGVMDADPEENWYEVNPSSMNVPLFIDILW